MPKVKNIASSSSGGDSIAHVETLDTESGWNVTPITIPNLDSTKKQPTDGFVANTTGFTNKWTGWAGKNGPPQGR